MNLAWRIAELEKNGSAIQHWLKHLEAEEVLWKPQPERWNSLEIVCHLLDEETLDFRKRVECLLEGLDPPPIDPEGWVQEHQYAQQHFTQTIQALAQARVESVEWLRGLKNPDWTRANLVHGLQAGDVLSAWVAHDLLHLKQLLRLHFEYVELQVAPFRLDYAGQWK